MPSLPSPRLGLVARRGDCRGMNLLVDEPRLQVPFGPLVQAHYRTTPSDLRLPLDGPGLGIAALMADDAPLGVVLTGR